MFLLLTKSGFSTFDFVAGDQVLSKRKERIINMRKKSCICSCSRRSKLSSMQGKSNKEKEKKKTWCSQHDQRWLIYHECGHITTSHTSEYISLDDKAKLNWILITKYLQITFRWIHLVINCSIKTAHSDRAHNVTIDS